MARSRREDELGAADNITSAQGGPPGIPGGASGVPTDATARLHSTAVVGSAVEGAPADDVPVRKYRVKVGGSSSFGGTRTTIRPGKVIDERQYDIEMLKNQGIVLEEIPAAAPPARAQQ